jgi:thioredoxin-related protein
VSYRWWSAGVALTLVALTLAALTLSQSGRAAHDPTTAKPSVEVQELIVLEAPNCIYCNIFRRDVLPSYQKSKRAGDLPIRFLDLNDPAADKLKLSAAVTIVPTIVLMRQGAETGRISGYTGPEAFFHSVARLLGSSE